ncbi:NAD(P)-binding protein [Ascoidea rubescens DSM 1968]|uniref:NAD(P)-binding protein n=1 Tax=Ascoidea rubescens DSM 1968 TaxID=1344418 RepID=A0A1D2VJL5_9ASCO|nr:NAD(P)-binding protein [Ascoidea rubescens DSM 1968]ODV61805.1 NAD(P)-binding protein [Ascoidea rubescens DSM 1968]
MSKLDGKVVLISGSATGIGNALVNEFAVRGYKVFATDIVFSNENINNKDKNPFLTNNPNGNVTPLYCNVAKVEEIRKLKQILIDDYKIEKIDILYNNAGVASSAPVTDINDEQLARVFDVNFFGCVRMVTEFFELVIKAKGIIAFTGSVTGELPMPFGATYSASKAALNQYARVLHLEVKGFGVRVINVVTGAVNTDLSDPTPFPETSIFNTEAGRNSFYMRKKVLKDGKAMEPNVYAQRVIDKLTKSGPNDFQIFEGHLAGTYVSISRYLPIAALESSLLKKFEMDKIYE